MISYNSCRQLMDLWTAAHFRYRVTDSTVEREAGNDAMTKGPTRSGYTTMVNPLTCPLLKWIFYEDWKTHRDASNGFGRLQLTNDKKDSAERERKSPHHPSEAKTAARAARRAAASTTLHPAHHHRVNRSPFVVSSGVRSQQLRAHSEQFTVLLFFKCSAVCSFCTWPSFRRRLATLGASISAAHTTAEPPPFGVRECFFSGKPLYFVSSRRSKLARLNSVRPRGFSSITMWILYERFPSAPTSYHVPILWYAYHRRTARTRFFG